ncbi:unnamed protein product [Owenia fusiformis]|uniref:PDZ domain-containing protein n=1 Tax=Owenia fusiformis TaxID=6347 RepID=A0A8S4NNB2_OWEFU|nr:unnamed protein product [Owenia fusiformis]
MTTRSGNIFLYHPVQHSTNDLTSTDGTMPSSNKRRLNIQAELLTKKEGKMYIHEIAKIEDGAFANKMKLQEGDALCEFMGVPLKFFSHENLMNTLKNFNQTQLDILVYRKTINREDPVFEINEKYIQLKITIQATASGDVEVEKVEEVNRTNQMIITFDYIDGIEFNGPIQIELKHIKTGKFMKIDGDNVWLAPNRKKDEASFQFMCLTFSGMDEPDGEVMRIMMLYQKEIFLRLQENYKEIPTPSVTLIESKPPPKDAHRVDEDPRLFIVKSIEGDAGRVRLASFMNKDLYLSCDPNCIEQDQSKVCFRRLSNTMEDEFTVFQLFDLDIRNEIN